MKLLLAALPALLAAAGGLAGCGGFPPSGEAGSRPAETTPMYAAAVADQIIAQAFAEQAHHVQVEGRGIVVRVLEDDKDGGCHQRFILRLASGQTILVAHNIDLAPRIRGLRVRDMVAFFGEYEWNDEGGTIHWTHRDPNDDHVAGWLRHRGRVYQ